MGPKIIKYVYYTETPSELGSFYRDTLGLKVLRHEEFSECCQSCMCEGLLKSVWSKTVFGFWPERVGFTIEVQHNRTRGECVKENQLISFTIRSAQTLQRARILQHPVVEKIYKKELISPNGLSFYVINELKKQRKDPFLKITLASTNLGKTLDYWYCLLGMKIFSKKLKSVVVGFGDKGIKLKFILVKNIITRGSNHLRITASIDLIKKIEHKMREYNQVIPTSIQTMKVDDDLKLTYLTLSDPDAHLIYLFEEEGFKNIGKPDPRANILLNKFIAIQQRIEEQKSFSNLSVLNDYCFGQKRGTQDNDDKDDN